MKRLYLIGLIWWCLLSAQQAARADGVVHLVLSETFDHTSGTGGHDGNFSGSIASSNILYDIDGWDVTKCGGASHCLKFGTTSDHGVCTTPEFVLVGTGKTATLTFNAAGWGDSGSNKLTVTANEGVTLTGNTSITLTNSTWTAYTVNIEVTTATSVQLTFTGKRGFLDDVKVEETVTAINAPTLPDDFCFWPATTETATKSITLIPSDSTTVYYTTDGTEPSTTNGQMAMLTSTVGITGTTTVKAKAYYETVGSEVVTKTYTVGATVSGVAAFNALADGTEARLYLADDDNARVLHGYNNKMYLRDNSGTLCFDFGETATFNPAPQHNQHVAGWVVGRKQTVEGLPMLVATDNTSTDYLALANPVTETPTAPTTVDDESFVNDHLGDWVVVESVREGLSLLIVDNQFDTEHFTDFYDRALADVSGIVVANNKVAPVFYDDIRPIVYVIDENQEFSSPAANIQGATVRLKRTLGRGYWNTFVVPMDLPISQDLAGEYRQYTSFSGNTMLFSDASSIEAGMPYLVKPYNDIENPVFIDVTLSATPAKDIENGGYSFVGIYSPTKLATDHTEMFLKTDGKLYYPSASGTRMKGMRAFFRVPKDSQARLAFADDVATELAEMRTENGRQGSGVYDMQGRSLSALQAPLKKGLYIVHGKKLVIR